MIVIGHRGARGLAPENTLAALQKGIEHGVDELEFDLRATKDHQVVLHHDRLLRDASGKALIIAKHSFHELQSHKPDLILLDDVLGAIKNDVALYIEVKPGEPTKQIIALLKKHIADGWKPANIRIASFDYSSRKTFHHALPELELVVNDHWSGVRATYRARALDTKRISISRLWLWSGFIRATSRRGYQLVAYTVNDPQKARKWARYGLYGVVTDYPDRFQVNR